MEPGGGRAGRRRRIADRLLHSRMRTWSLVGLSVVLFGAAIVIGLPPQSSLPTGFGRIVALPVLPAADAPDYTIGLGWHVRHSPAPEATLVTDTFWTDSSAFDSETGLPVYLAVTDDATTEALLGCSAGQRPSDSQAPELVEVTALPAAQKALLDALDREEYGAIRGGYRFLRVDDRATGSGGYPFSECRVDPGTMITKDEVELHLQAPNLTVLTPKPSTNAKRKDTARAYAVVQALPAGWSPQDVRALSGKRTDRDIGIYWDATAITDSRTGALADVVATSVGPVTFEASSLNASRRADRALFWSGLFVGLAGSCLLMLYEGLPWRTGPSRRSADPTTLGP